MSSQGGPDDSWWDEVYVGPRDDIPDTPRADTRRGTVDDWFDSLSGVFGEPAAAPADGGEPVRGEPVRSEPSRNEPLRSEPVRSEPGAGSTVAADGAEPGSSGTAGRSGGTGGPPTLVEDATLRLPRQSTSARPPAPAEPAPAPAPAPAPVREPDLDLDRDLEPDPGPEPEPVAEPLSFTKREPVPEPDVPAAVPGFGPVEELPPLPVRPPRIPALKPDPRISTSAPAPAPARATPTEPSIEVPAETASEAASETAVTAPLPHVGERPPTYDPEPTALPPADPDHLGELVPDTVLEGARYGTMTLRAASVRGDSARYRGGVRGDRLLAARFGEGSDALLVVVLATPSAGDDPAAADDACRQLAASVGRSRAELLDDLRTGAQEGLRYGLQRLTARATVRLRGPEQAEASDAGGALHALIAPLDPTSRLRAGFGVGPGGLLLLGDAAWYDAYAGRRLAQQPPRQLRAGTAGGAASGAVRSEEDGRFRFRMVVPERGDVLLLCSDGLVQPLREEPAVSDFLAAHWSQPHPPGTVDFLRHVQVRAKGYAADRTAVAVWED
ncbi:hypothetical protein GXW83_09870 [Streptacidiphilus sp. PB12-B1b]|uniref:hypothetical protein n=1 Tax=Streptacidiphilus sp. PB12-B1b TaxID=2705012 RepID=UPI0015F8DA66|nr:hypothetical protein [Streptacidiphilus sp. PB12-B1b]QMU75997.1 hypothetical protein GXW83_09870 [Streptacidiphilus sp. PB12-B1b]